MTPEAADPMGLDAVMPRLLAAFPEFEDEWERYKRSGAYAPGEPYNDVGKLAEHLVASIAADDTAGFDALFSAAEALMAGGSAFQRKLLIVGLLEDLQNLSLNASIALSRWEPWLGPSSAEAWLMLRRVWSREIGAAQFNSYVDGAVANPDGPR